MQNSFTKKFERFFAQLPLFIQEQADRAFEFFEQNPHHNSLQFKCVDRSQELYSIRINAKGYRALGNQEGNELTWDWIGPHDEYMRRIRGK